MQELRADDWVGRVQEATDRVSLGAVRALAATLDLSPADADAADLVEGGVLPPLWHWLCFLPDAPTSALAEDGHPARGDFLPPVPLERRMWAGGRLRFLGPIRIGDTIHRRSEILAVREKRGAAGPMVFVTVGHTYQSPDGPTVSEEQDIVYIAMPEQYVPPPPLPVPEPTAWSEPVAIDPVRLFRFSAVTFNAHRIHFDRAYATGVERYPGLVVHGPLQAMLLMQAACRQGPHRQPKAFSFRGVRPAFDFDTLHLAGSPEADGAQDLFTATDAGAVCMQARIEWDE